jgi:hypothetical protein
MENVGNKPKLRSNSLILLELSALAIFLATMAFAPKALAGVVLTQPDPSEQTAPGEAYPESRFGRAPAKVDDGSSAPLPSEAKSFASREVEDMDSSDESAPVGGANAPGRLPAGLEFSGHSGSRAALPPVDSSAGQPGAAGTSRFGGSNREGATGALTLSANQVQPTSVVARKGVQEVAVIASDLGFFPKTVFVSRDVPVRMFVTGSSKSTLCLMMDSFQVRKQVRSQKIEEITFTPAIPGKYRFYCPVNGAEGMMIVKEFASSRPDVSDSVSGSQAAPLKAETAPIAPAVTAPGSRRQPAASSSTKSSEPVAETTGSSWLRTTHSTSDRETYPATESGQSPVFVGRAPKGEKEAM